ncbi:MAG: hypothetical protein GX631_04695 [Dehalococcoidales bacterium]|jgi:hypothetical protein|nr:hypothetical protein [Dehalococcoidales bacterium]
MKKHHSVYVILLSSSVITNKKFRAANRGFNIFLPCYYVGMTGLTPEKRFENHKREYKSSRIVRRYGLSLVPEIYQRFNPMSYRKAARIEKALAEALRRRGHGVWQR